MKKEEICKHVDTWIAQEELPTNPALKPIRKFDGLFPEDPIEANAYFDFMQWYFQKEHEVLLSIPVKHEYNGPVEGDDSLSFPFSSMDYNRKNKFDKYQYKLKMIYKRIWDLATTYSSISHQEGKQNTLRKYQCLVNDEFRNKAIELVKTYNKHKVWMNRERLLEKIDELNKRIGACKRIWNKYAFIP